MEKKSCHTEVQDGVPDGNELSEKAILSGDPQEQRDQSDRVD